MVEERNEGDSRLKRSWENIKCLPHGGYHEGISEHLPPCLSEVSYRLNRCF